MHIFQQLAHDHTISPAITSTSKSRIDYDLCTTLKPSRGRHRSHRVSLTSYTSRTHSVSLALNLLVLLVMVKSSETVRNVRQTTATSTITSPTPVSKNTYLVTGPRVIRPGTRYDVTVHILKELTDTSPVNLEASIVALPLKTDDGFILPRPRAPIPLNDVEILAGGDDTSGTSSTVKAINEPVVIAKASGQFTSGDAKILQIQLPSNFVEYGSRRLVLRVKADGGIVTTSPITAVTDDKKSVSIVNPFPSLRDEADLTFTDKVRSVFIQTDKAKYKPGDKVQFRVLVLDQSLKPVKGQINVFITDPSENRIKQWLNEPLSHGLFKAHLQLADKAVLGDWKINVNFIDSTSSNASGLSSLIIVPNVRGGDASSPISKSFTVEEYVLPTFDVKLVIPPYGVLDVVNKLVTVKGYFEAKYTFGGNVPGKATINLKDSYGEYNSTLGSVQYTQTEKVINLDESSPNTKHDFEIVIDYKDNKPNYNKDQFEYGRSFTVTFTFVDSLTLKTKSVSQDIRFYIFPYELKLIGPTYYKPGLTFTLRIVATHPDGTPLSPTDVTELLNRLKSLGKNTANLTSDNYLKLTQILDYDKLAIDPNSYVKQLYKERLIGLDQQGQSVLVLDDVGTNVIRVAFEAVFDGQARTYYFTSNKFEEPAGIFLELRNLQPLASDKNILKLGSNHNIEGYSSVPISNLTALFIAKGKIVGVRSLNIQEATKRIEISFPVTLSLVPAFRVIAYFVTGGPNGGNVIVDSIDYKVDRFSDNFVELTFVPGPNATIQTSPDDSTTGQNISSPLTLKPRDTTILNVKTNPNSLVGLLAVDQSVRILATGNDITSDLIESELNSYDTSDFYPRPFYGRGTYFPPWGRSGNALQIFKNAGLLVLTDATIHQAPEFVARTRYGGHHFRAAAPRRGFAFASDSMGFGGAPVALSASTPAQFMLAKESSLADIEGSIVTRADFPETWIWEDVTADANGMVNLTKIVPDTITTWVATALSIDDENGLAVSSIPAQIRVFQPFFVTLSLPYSIVRGEKMRLQALVYNYLGKDVSAIVTLEPPNINTNGTNDSEPDFEILTIEDFANSVSRSDNPSSTTPNAAAGQLTIDNIKEGEIYPAIFYIRALKVGPLKLKVKVVSQFAGDALEKIIPVKAEGEQLFFNQPFLINLNEPASSSTTFSEKFSIPWDTGAMILGSNHLEVSIIGDIMGPTLNNLGNLVRLPYGCGEQNMLNFAPNLYVYEYLRTKKLLTPALKDQIATFTEKGYQRQLTYQRQDGSFSAFGRSDKAGSLWLTAFVLRSFVDASEKGLGIIYIDPKIIEDALLFILENQILPPYQGSLNEFTKDVKDIGSFVEVGEIHHKPLQGGASKGLGLTAYVYVALRETANKYFANLTSYTGGSSQIKDPDRLIKRLSTAILLAESFILSRVGPLLLTEKNPNFPFPLSTYDLAIATYALTLASKSPLNTTLDLNIRYPVSVPSATSVNIKISDPQEIRSEPTAALPSNFSQGGISDYFMRAFNADVIKSLRITDTNIPNPNIQTNGTQDVSLNLNVATHNDIVRQTSNDLIQKLLGLGKAEKGSIFWKNIDSSGVNTPCDNPITQFCRFDLPPSLDIETTAYVLLTLTTAITAGDTSLLNRGLPVLKWLVNNRNTLGGYSSTQDTIVSLNALTKFASLLPPIEQQNLAVTVQGDTESHDITITANNLLVKNVFEFGTKLEKELTIGATGKGTALVQISWSYNVIGKEKDRGFDLEVKSGLRNNTLLLDICMKYNIVGENQDVRSNMIVLEINAPSGFTIDKDSLTPFDTAPKFAELIDANTKINLYFDSLGARKECLKLNMEKLYEVQDIKPSLVKLSDYYQPELKKTAYIEFQKL